MSAERDNARDFVMMAVADFFDANDKDTYQAEVKLYEAFQAYSLESCRCPRCLRELIAP